MESNRVWWTCLVEEALSDIQPLDYLVSIAWKLQPGVLPSVQLFEIFSILAEVLKCWYVSMDRRSLNEIEFGRVETEFWRAVVRDDAVGG